MSLKTPVSCKDHIQGNLHAAIELVEFGDFQCSFCGQAYQTVKALQQTFGENLKFVFRNFPLAKVHPEAKMAAIAAEAAGSQGKFWETHDVLFENQKCLYASWLMKYAEQIGLDSRQFEADLFNDHLIKKVEEDFESGLRSGINRTPGFFINGEIYNDNWEKNLSAYIKSKIDSLVQNHNSSQIY